MNTLRFTVTHEWVLEKEDGVLVGITAHAQELLGDLVYVELPKIGLTVEAGNELGVVESVKAAADIYTPVSGEVIAINEAIRENPGIVNTHPYSEGWLVKIKPSNPGEIELLLTEKEYQQSLHEGQ